MKKQNLWARVRNVFNPDENNGLTKSEIDVLNRLKDKKEFQDLMFEPLQMYSAMVEKHGKEEVMLWLAEFINQEIDENLKAVASFFHSLCQVSGKHNLGYAFQLTESMGFGFEVRRKMEEEVEKNESTTVTVLNTQNPIVEKPEVVQLELVEVKPKPAIKLSYNHPLAKGKIYSTKLFQEVWEILPDYFTRQSANMAMEKHKVGSGAFLNSLIQNTFKDGLLRKPKYGYYEKVHPKNKIINEPLEALIEEEKEVELKMTLEKSKEPIRKLYPVPYNREEGNDVYGLRDYITLDNAQKVFGLNKRYVLNLVNYNHILDVGKTLIDNKWMCVLNYHELKGYCERKQSMADSVGYAKNCESCNNTFNAWSEHLNYCRSCISKL
jgi:hypothetical protein